MKVLGILSFIILVLGITFYISSPYIHVAFFEGPIGSRKHNSEKQQSPQIPHQNTNRSPVMNQTSQSRIKTKEPIRQFVRPSTSPSQTPSLSFEKLMASLREYNSDSYRVDAIRKLVSRLGQNLSGNDLFRILDLFNSDSYRVDAIRKLVSRLGQNLSGNDLFRILDLFDSDSYRVDAIRAFQSQLKPSYSNSDLGRISQLFTSDSYRTEALTLLH